MSTFQKIKLADVAKVISGFAFKSSEFGDEGVPVLKIANIRMGGVETAFCQRVSAEHLKKLPDKYQVQRGDILISLTGSHVTQPNSVVGRVARMGTTKTTFLLNQRAGKIIVQDHERVDPDFLYFSLMDNASKGEIASMASGAASQANVSPTQVGTLQVLAPPLPTQQRIAAILSAYDDLLENNTRRIAILEEMARRLYEEWFVHFRFPGHQHSDFDGDLPTGWERLPISTVAEFKRGKQQLTKKAYVEEGYTAYSASGPDGFLDGWEAEGKAVIVSGVGAYCGKTWLARGKWTCIANTFYLRPTGSNVSAELLYLATFGIDFWPRRGAAQPFISTGDAGAKEIAVAPAAIMSAFNCAAVPMFEQLNLLQRKNANLRAQRDLLLPKLVSGEIDVSEAEKAMEAAE